MASDGDWFWPLAGAALLAWFAYDKWWAKDDPPRPPLPIPGAQADAPPPRPTGQVFITQLKNGTIWRLDADSVKGPRSKRIGWLIQDHSGNKSEPARRSSEIYIVNCETTAFTVPRRIDYDKDGVSMGSMYGSDQESFVPPESNGGRVVAEICDHKFDEPDTAPVEIPPPVSIK